MNRQADVMTMEPMRQSVPRSSATETTAPLPTPMPTPGQEINLRLWFVGFVCWMTVLTAVTVWGVHQAEHSGSVVGWVACVLAATAFYLSLCCAFVPAPTTGVVLWAASNGVAWKIGVVDHEMARLLLVASVCSLASALANLNEYHVVTCLLQVRRIAKVRQTRLYATASEWFRRRPFGILTLFSFLPIPVDVIRWLAILSRYSRLRFFVANVIGRWFRYALCAAVSLGFGLTDRHILIIQVSLIAVALARIGVQFWRRNNSRNATRAAAA
jgi:membrane protein YqaA with SNARE-associated domain